MDLDVLYLLRAKLVFELPLVDDKIGHYIGLQEFRYLYTCIALTISKMGESIHWDTLRFIIEDLVTKLESVLGVRTSDGQQYAITDVYLINSLVKFFPNIMNFFVQVSI